MKPVTALRSPKPPFPDNASEFAFLIVVALIAAAAAAYYLVPMQYKPGTGTCILDGRPQDQPGVLCNALGGYRVLDFVPDTESQLRLRILAFAVIGMMASVLLSVRYLFIVVRRADDTATVAPTADQI